MYYSIKHTTHFRYNEVVSESITEVRMHPGSDAIQRCLNFSLRVTPRAQVHQYRDFNGNIVHHFDIPRSHSQLSIMSRSTVEMLEPPDIPESLGPCYWVDIDEMTKSGEYYFELTPSQFTQATELLRQLARELNMEQRRGDPLRLLRELNTSIHGYFDYSPRSTDVDSPIDVALQLRKGVCQDFAHIMLAIVREYLKIPCRYVSGYLFHVSEQNDRSAADATHAWVEVLLPELGWVGFDPTNNLIAGQRHIRAAIGRDYQDVPPTRGIMKGSAESEMTVAVEVKQCAAPVTDVEDIEPVSHPLPDALTQQQQQQQQQ